MNSNLINLKSLFNLSAKLNSSQDIYFILNSALLSIMGKLGISKGAIYQVKKGVFELTVSKGEAPEIKSLECSNEGLSEIDKKHLDIIDFGYHYYVCLKFNNSIQVVILLGDKLSKKEINETEKQYTELVCTIASIAIQNAENFINHQTQKNTAERKTQLLSTLFEISRDYSSLLNKETILKTTSFNIMGQLMVNKYAIFTINSDNSINEEINTFGKEFEISTIRSLLNHGKLTMVKDLNSLNENDRKALIEYGIEIIAPMVIKGVSKGIMLLGKKLNKDGFTEDNLLFAEAMANTTITSLENERLVNEEIKKQQLEKEMDLALEIQQGLLPKEIPPLDKYDVYGTSIPSKQVGGDYFDYIKIDDDRYFVLVADVSGKGIPAAMLMANLQSALRVIVPLDLDLKLVFKKINNLVFENTSSDKFITFFGGIFNLKTQIFNYINAGHNPPLLIRNGEYNLLSEGGLILGLIEDYENYEVGEVKLSSGDCLIMYTDGLVEANNQTGEEFGEDKFIEEAIQSINLSSKQIVEKLIDDVKLHSYGANQYDDLTLLALKVS